MRRWLLKCWVGCTIQAARVGVRVGSKPSTLVGHLYLSGQANQVTCSLSLYRSDPNSQLLQRSLIRASWLLYTEPSLGSRGRSAHNAVGVRSSLDCPTLTRDARHYDLCLDLYSPCPFPFFYFPYAGLTYPIHPDSRISLVALPQLISFSVLADYGSIILCVPPLLPGSGITCCACEIGGSLR